MQLASPDAAHARFDTTVAALRKTLLRHAKLDSVAPKFATGRQASILVETIATYAATVTAVSGYTTVVQSITPPTLQVQSDPSGPGVSQDVYDDYVNNFIPTWNQFHQQTALWMNPGQPSSGIYQDLANIPTTIVDANYGITTQLNALLNAAPGTSAYNTALSSLDTQITNLLNTLQPMQEQLQSYAAALVTCTDAVIQQANSGALQGALQGYQSEIDHLNGLVDTAQDAVSQGCTDLLEDTAALGGFFVMGVVGLIGFFTPEPSTSVYGGLLTVAAGVGFVGTVADMVSVGISIAGDKSEISVYRNSIDIDGQSLTDLGVIINQINGFSAMNARAIAALEQVSAAYQELLNDIDDVYADAEDGDPQSASDDWDAIINSAELMSANAAYYWPNCYDIYECKTIAPTSSGMMALRSDGSCYSFDLASNIWTSSGVRAVSLVATNDVVLRINGVPLSATSGETNNSYHVSLRSGSTWTDISSFAVANITAFGSDIYAVRSGYTGGATPILPGSELTEVLKYTGSGTSWSSLGSPDPEDIPAFIEAYRDGVLVTTLRFGRCYFWNGSAWNRIGSANDIVLQPVAVNTGFSMIDANFSSFISSPSDPRLLYTDSQIYSTWITASFVQYVVTSSGELCSIVQQNGENEVTNIVPNVMAIYGESTGQYFYFVDRLGYLYYLSGTGSSATWDLIAPLPT